MQRRQFLAVTTALAVAHGFDIRETLSASAGMSATDAKAFTLQFGSKAYLPGSAEYETLRHIYNVKADRHPAVIVHCTTSDDVRQVVDLARTQRSPLSVRCGGHSYAGYGLNDGGVVIDLSGLRELTIAEDKQTIRVGGGALVGAIDAATAAVGRAAVLGQCSSVGIGGFALGGGVGPLMSAYGLCCDNLLAAQVVLADGRMVTASADENSDLFWAIRGGGGNFGVVTEFTLKLHPVAEVLAGDLIFRADQPAELLRTFDAYAQTIPDSLTLLSLFVPGEGGKPMFISQVCYVGDPTEGERVLAPILKSPFLVDNTVARKPYLEIQSATPSKFPPLMHENRGGFIAKLDDAVIAELVQIITTAPANYMLGVVHLHGAVTRVAADATAFPLRSAGMAWGLTGFWKKPADRDAVINWAKASASALSSHGAGAYVNVMDAEDKGAVRKAYVGNYARLARLKTKYDPTNLFAFNQNIEPA